MRRRTLALSLVAAVAMVAAPGQAAAAPKVAAPAGPDQLPLEVEVDAAAAEVRTRRGGGAVQRHRIGIDAARIDEAHVVAEVVPVGEGRTVVHVRVPDRERKDLAFELVASGRDDAPVFAGLTGYTSGSEGDRSGQVVLVTDRDDANKFVLVADVREDTRICGQDVTPLVARGVDPRTMQLRGATLHRLDKATRDRAKRIVATRTADDAKAPLGRVLTATGGSAADASRLSDGKTDVAFVERRPGDGHGEFATLRAAAELPLHAVRVTVAPTTPPEAFAAPRTFYLATDAGLFHVTLPEDAVARPGRAYEVPLPAPVRTSCVAFVFDDAYAPAGAAKDVGVAELEALTTFDVEGASLDDVARALAGPRAEEAAALLRRAGDGGLAAASTAFAQLDDRGRALAVDVAASAGTCEGAGMNLLARALVDREREVRRRALGRIERCGKAAGPTLATVLAGGDDATRIATAPVLATVAPRAALGPLAAELGKGSADARRAVRTAFARASSVAPRDELVKLLVLAPDQPAARIDLLRGASARLGELRPESAQALAGLLVPAPDFATRYVLLGPLASLARAEGATAGELTRMSETIRRDPDWPVRAHAVSLAAGVGPLEPAVVAAASDPEPRVREAALRVVKERGLAGGAGVARSLLASDPWTFVRVAAAEAVSALPLDDAASQALARATNDPSARVRAAVLGGVVAGRTPASLTKAVRARLDDGREAGEVRAMAARALGQLCDRGSTDRLTELALLARAPIDEADDAVGLASLDALAALHPADLAKRIAPLRDKNVRAPLRRAAERALEARGQCR